MLHTQKFLGGVAALLIGGGGAWADSIDPDTFEATLAVGESVTITKTVTVDEGTPTSSRADVFFLVDTSGSMGGTIGAVQTFASDILTSTAGFGDVGWGVGSYEDVPVSPWGSSFGDLPWRLNQAITTDTVAAQAGISTLSLGSGADGPESNLIALSEAADEAGWRAGAQKFIVWFGDAPGHDPDAGAPTALGSGSDGLGGFINAGDPYPGPTLAETIATLTGESITVIGLNSGSASFGLDSTGQATAITDATGGLLEPISGTPAGDIVAVIEDALTTAFASYSSVALSAVGNLPGVDVSFTDAILGAFDRSETREFEFEVTFTALEEGVHSFTIDALVDGGVVATESDRIIVPTSVPPVPLPASLPLLLGALALGGLIARRRRA